MSHSHFVVKNSSGLALAKFNFENDAIEFCDRMNAMFFGGYTLTEVMGRL